jgi:NADPH-dependent 2,4-dienoyl-CoA reductase/sulfur reductase-like enzyme
MTLWTVPDADRIRNAVREHHAKSAVVVGGGFIGLEMAENLHHAGLEVTLVEMLPQVMAPLDFEMAQLLHENLEQNAVEALTWATACVLVIEEANGEVTVTLKSGKIRHGRHRDLIHRHQGQQRTGQGGRLEVNGRGGVVTDDTLRTSDPDISTPSAT